MKGEWIPAKARGLIGIFPGSWEEVQTGVFQGRCPGEHLHHGTNAPTDCRIYLGYGGGAAGKDAPPGAFCLHKSCAGVLEPLNTAFRDGIFAKDPDWKPSGAAAVNQGVVQRAPREREGWIPEFNISKLRGLVQGVPAVSEDWFMERSPIDPRKVTPGDFIEHTFKPGERVIVFTEFKGPGDFLWEVGKGGYRLGEKRDVRAVRSKLPVDGGAEGVWYLCNPVDGKWYANPRRAGKYSRRSMESVTSWRHLVLESDEEKTLRKRAAGLREAAAVMTAGGLWTDAERVLEAVKGGGPKWVKAMMAEAPSEATYEHWTALAEQYVKDAGEVPGLWMRLLAMAPLAIKAIYSSGGGSWHALVEVNMADKATFDTYLRESAKKTLPLIGADPGAMTPVRLTRLPGCTRRGVEQKLIYLNPNPSRDGVPIRDLTRVRSL